ncbi:1731_t:CDS:1, partial [Gigaspora rosea]
KSKMLEKYSMFQKAYENFRLRAPILKDLLEAKLIMVLKSLITKDCTWALALREIIAKVLKEQRDTCPLLALNSNPVKLKS